jgi:hypothetical protein
MFKHPWNLGVHDTHACSMSNMADGQDRTMAHMVVIASDLVHDWALATAMIRIDRDPSSVAAETPYSLHS